MNALAIPPPAWAHPVSPYPRDSTVCALFQDVARQYPGETALKVRNGVVSYRALDRQSNALAHVLLAAGAGRGDRVALLLPRGAAFIACALGVLKAGAAYVPLNPSDP